MAVRYLRKGVRKPMCCIRLVVAICNCSGFLTIERGLAVLSYLGGRERSDPDVKCSLVPNATQPASAVNSLTDGLVDTWHLFQGARGKKAHEDMWCVGEVCSPCTPAL